MHLNFEFLFLKKIFEISSEPSKLSEPSEPSELSEPSGHQVIISYDIWIIIIKRQII